MIRKMMLMALSLLCGAALEMKAQSIAGSPEYIKALTAEWKGERFPDGRPKVSDNLLDRLKNVTIEECWAELMKLGYQNQYEGDWMLVHETEDAVMVGRAVALCHFERAKRVEKSVRRRGGLRKASSADQSANEEKRRDFKTFLKSE